MTTTCPAERRNPAFLPDRQHAVQRRRGHQRHLAHQHAGAGRRGLARHRRGAARAQPRRHHRNRDHRHRRAAQSRGGRGRGSRRGIPMRRFLHPAVAVGCFRAGLARGVIVARRGPGQISLARDPHRLAVPGGRGLGYFAPPARRAARRTARHPDRHREPADRRRRCGSQGRARLAAGRPHARALVERHRGQRRAVQETALRPACGFRAGRRHQRFLLCVPHQCQVGAAHSAGRDRGGARQSGQAQFRHRRRGYEPQPHGAACFARSPASISRWCRFAARPT